MSTHDTPEQDLPEDVGIAQANEEPALAEATTPQEQTDFTAVNQRRFCRYPLAGMQMSAELKVGRRRIPVQVINESSGGFAVVCVEDPQVSADDVVQLHSPKGQFEVRIAHLRELSPKPGYRFAPVYELGLECLDELYETPRVLPWGERLRVGCSFPLQGTTTAIVTVFLFILPLGFIASHFMSDGNSWSDAIDWVTRHKLGHWSSTTKSASHAPAVFRLPNTGSGGKVSSTPSEKETGSGKAFPRGAFSLNSHGLLGRLRVRDVTVELGLNNEQKGAIQKIVTASDEALDMLQSQRYESSEELERQQRALRAAAQREIERHLTRKQRAQWAELLARAGSK